MNATNTSKKKAAQAKPFTILLPAINNWKSIAEVYFQDVNLPDFTDSVLRNYHICAFFESPENSLLPFPSHFIHRSGQGVFVDALYKRRIMRIVWSRSNFHASIPAPLMTVMIIGIPKHLARTSPSTNFRSIEEVWNNFNLQPAWNG